MLNLFVAVIISDFEKLNYESEKQNLINMAQYSVLVEKILRVSVLKKMRINIDQKLTICLHEVCKENEDDSWFKVIGEYSATNFFPTGQKSLKSFPLFFIFQNR